MKGYGVMEGKRTELEEKIYCDVQTEIRNYYDSNDIKYRSNEEPEYTIIDFLSYLYRLIPITKRKVHYSKELSKKIDLKEIDEKQAEILKQYSDAFSEGKNMNVFLSNNIKEPKKPDFLLYTWHLYHLHMSGKFVEDINQMKNNRSDTQLLCIINMRDVYFVDVISHPKKAEEYFDLQKMKIIKENGWMEKIGFYEIKDMIPESLEPKITEINEIFELYKLGINLSFEFDGKAYSPLAQMSQARRPVDATQKLFEINRKISKLNNVTGTYMGFQFDKEIDDLVGYVKFGTPSGEVKFNIF